MSVPGRNPSFAELPVGADAALSSSIGIGTDLTALEVLKQVLQHRLTHVVQKSSMSFDQEIQTAQRMCADPHAFFRFPLSTVLSPHTPNGQQESDLCLLDFAFDSPHQRDSAIQQTREKLEGSVNRDLLSDVLLIADEFYTNAVQHAPLAGQPASEMQRKVLLLKGARLKPGQIKVGKDGERVVIVCSDQYGTLDVRRLVQQMHDVVCSGMTPEVGLSPKGSGVGIYLIYMACVGFYVGVQPGKQTMLCASLPLKGGRNKRSQMPKNLHISYTAASYAKEVPNE